MVVTMNTLQKAEAYDRVIEIIRKCKTDKYGCIIGIKPSDIFSELKDDDEDEKIRKWLIALIKSNEYGSISNVGKMPYSKLNVLAWLEKQCNQNSIDEVNNKLVPKFSVGQRIRHRSGEMPAFVIDRIEDDHYRGKNNESVSIVFQDDWELVEQKSIKCNVDIKSEVSNWWNNHYNSVIGYTFEGHSGHYLENSTIVNLAQYFYKLGTNSK